MPLDDDDDDDVDLSGNSNGDADGEAADAGTMPVDDLTDEDSRRYFKASPIRRVKEIPALEGKQRNLGFLDAVLHLYQGRMAAIEK